MDAIKAAMAGLQSSQRRWPTSLRSLLVDGVIAGRGSVLVFPPHHHPFASWAPDIWATCRRAAFLLTYG
jgi:hypothetical protein